MKSYGVTIQIKATEEYFPVILYADTLCCTGLFLPFESVNKIIWCDHSNETSLAVLSLGSLMVFQHFTK